MKSRRPCAIASASPSPVASIRLTSSSWTNRAGSAPTIAALGPQRLLWASTGTKDPNASDILYIKALAAPFTVNMMPEETLTALADHGKLGPIMAVDGGDCETVLQGSTEAGVNVDGLAAQLQEEGAKSFVKSWNELLAVIAAKSEALKRAA